MEISGNTKEIVSHDLQTRTYFNNLADSWESKQSTDTQKIEELLSRLNLINANTILDIGCGTGVLFPVFEKLAPGKTKFFAVDFAECMAKTASLHCNSKTEVICGDSQNLPFMDSFFNLIIAFHVFPHIKDKPAALQEYWRILKPEGDLAIIHLRGSKELNEFHAELGGEVASHILPSAEELSRIMSEMKFDVKDSIDESLEYYVRAVKPKPI
jgi:ubiquinone/menaquinone biosynthesis C-methylase UbiE